jgi:hypothetical protein
MKNEDVPKAKATEESLVQAGWKNQFNLTMGLRRKD